ncbi:UvrD-helicase domain-containing protein [uncultured Cellulomonas sp.]|uniref:UvrD-helicase domain-containing protein n=1 Tax=uncultured Cellulomonas sp. TaxID=189682 RepID=UPI002628199E|nr:UvrD-helicase domain-containing protein [uncultured Cellulomonas sp.]
MSTAPAGAAIATSVFDVCGPLPSGTTVLEASAGTGKTFTIAALATRYVAEGHAELSDLMLVTFGRAATSELRDRVRDRLVTTERALRDPDAARSSDALVRHLAAGGDDQRVRRRRRLTTALAQFDAATIATTHGFCQQMLGALGTAGDVDADAVLVPDIADLVDEVVDDLYVRAYAASRPALTVDDARRTARTAVSDHDAELRPPDAEPASEASHRVRLAGAVRAELARRKRARRVLDYDDLLVLLRDALVHPVTGPAAVERVRSRYRVVMVDEFQDTDPVQWEILRAAFHGHRTLVLIGDPKQAIYAFRGADVVTYLRALGEADTVQTLGRNWRSDEAVLDGLAAVLGPTALGDPRIVVRPVDAEHRERRLDGGPPVRLRQVTRASLGVTGVRNPKVGAVRDLIYADVAAQVVASLSTTRLRDGDGWRPLRPGDVAVLARRNADASAIRAALADAGVPAVESGVSSVFTAPAARHWLAVLTALSQPGHSGRVAAAALTVFVGWTARDLAQASDADRDVLADRLRTWAHVLDEQGVAALLERSSAEGLTERLLRTTTGERMLTDLRHIGQALHEAAIAGRMGTVALTEWLRTRVAEAETDYAEERSRRLDTDAAAVQVVTVHASKGLEFPVVHVPFAWDRYVDKNPAQLRYHDHDGTRLLHLGGPGSPGYDDARSRHVAEEFGEDLRIAYVALTRAASQVVVWWAPSTNSASAPLTRLLLGGHGPGAEPPHAVRLPDDDAVATALGAVAARSAGSVRHEVVEVPVPPAHWDPPTADRPTLAVGSLTRGLDPTWRRTSYSGLTAAAHDASVSTEPEVTGVRDEPGSDAGPGSVVPLPGTDGAAEYGTAEDGAASDGAAQEARLRGVPSPMSDLPGGTTFGTLVHEVLEHVDTGTGDLAAELGRHCREASLTRGLGVQPDALAAALLPVMSTPLGPAADGRTLGEISPADRLAELVFELPLAGGDEPRAGAATLRAVGDLLRRHLPADDPFAAYADRLTGPGMPTEPLRGYLTGSIDAVLRIRPDHDGDVRYVVVDYKTNRLAPVAEPVTAWHYRPQAMVAAMIDAHYPLQLLLYSVALHRFLRWRQPGYDPDRHLGGGLYLFVRGMAGPTTPVVDGLPCGVLGWRPPTALVVELSALIDGGTP